MSRTQRRRQAQAKKDQEIDRLRNQQNTKGDKGKGKGKGKSGMYTSKDNVPICYKFAKDNNCSDVCPFGRAHACQLCLGAHWNERCELWRGKKTGGKGSRK